MSSAMTSEEKIEAILEIKEETVNNEKMATDNEKRLNDIHPVVHKEEVINQGALKTSKNEDTCDTVKELKIKIMELENQNQLMKEQLDKFKTDFDYCKLQMGHQREILLSMEKSYFEDLMSFKEKFKEHNTSLKAYEIKWESKLKSLKEHQEPNTSCKFLELQEEVKQLKESSFIKDNEEKTYINQCLSDVQSEVKTEINNIKSQLKRLDCEPMHDDIIRETSDKFMKDRDKYLIEIYSLQQYKRKIDIEIDDFKTQLGSLFSKVKEIDGLKIELNRLGAINNVEPVEEESVLDAILAQTSAKFTEVKEELFKHMHEINYLKQIISLQKDHLKEHESKIQSNIEPLQIQVNAIMEKNVEFNNQTDVLTNLVTNIETRIEDLEFKAIEHMQLYSLLNL